MNGQVEVTWRKLRTITHALMVHARVPEIYVHFALMYTIDHIFPVLPIKDLIDKDGDPTKPYKLATGTKNQCHIYVFYFVRVLYKKLRRTLRKDIKHASPSTKRVSRHLRGNTTALKRIPCVRTQY